MILITSTPNDKIHIYLQNYLYTEYGLTGMS